MAGYQTVAVMWYAVSILGYQGAPNLLIFDPLVANYGVMQKLPNPIFQVLAHLYYVKNGSLGQGRDVHRFTHKSVSF